MPRKRAPARAFRRKHKPLTAAQEFELAMGFLAVFPSSFASEKHRRRAWFEHRGEIGALLSPGERAWAQDLYEGHHA